MALFPLMWFNCISEKIIKNIRRNFMSDIIFGMPTLIEFKNIYEAVSLCKS